MITRINTVIAHGEYLIDNSDSHSHDDMALFFKLLNELFLVLEKASFNEELKSKIEYLKNLNNNFSFPKNKIIAKVFLNDLKRFRSRRTVKAFMLGETYFFINEIIEQLNGLRYQLDNLKN